MAIVGPIDCLGLGADGMKLGPSAPEVLLLDQRPG